MTHSTVAAISRACSAVSVVRHSPRHNCAPNRPRLVIRAYQDAPSSPWPQQQAAAAAASTTSSSTSTAWQQHAAAPPRQRVATYRGLSASQFQHPLDQQNTRLLRVLPGLELVARNLMGPAAEQVFMLEHISTSIKTGPDQLPSLHRLLTEAATMLQMEVPDLYVRQNPVPNAYTLAIAGRTPFIVVHTALLELLTPEEVQAVLAHELGHLKCDHGVWLTAANVLAMGTVSLLPVVSAAVEEGLLRWLRAAELTCDRAALLVAQDRWDSGEACGGRSRALAVLAGPAALGTAAE